MGGAVRPRHRVQRVAVRWHRAGRLRPRSELSVCRSAPDTGPAGYSSWSPAVARHIRLSWSTPTDPHPPRASRLRGWASGSRSPPPRPPSSSRPRQRSMNADALGEPRERARFRAGAARPPVSEPRRASWHPRCGTSLRSVQYPFHGFHRVHPRSEGTKTAGYRSEIQRAAKREAPPPEMSHVRGEPRPSSRP